MNQSPDSESSDDDYLVHSDTTSTSTTTFTSFTADSTTVTTKHSTRSINTTDSPLHSSSENTSSTPPQVTEAIIYGIKMWINNQNTEQSSAHAPTVGSLRGPDVLLTAAFTEQYHSIGWYHMFMGRLGKKWSVAVALYRNVPNDYQSCTIWTTQATTFLWKYTRQLWSYRNTVVHGANDQEKADKIRADIAEKVISLYSQFCTTPQFILQ